MKYLIANWKAELNKQAAEKWLIEFTTLVNNDGALLDAIHSEEIKLIICPPFPYLSMTKEALKSLPQAEVGAQAVSPKNAGKYTGEVTAEMLKKDVTYAIIGHSERRNYNHETDEDVAEQVKRCFEVYIKPIICVRNTEDEIPPQVTLVAYEPVEAIGTGMNASVEDIRAMKESLNLADNSVFIYGGSVKADNIRMYSESGIIDGFLVGSASTQAESFYQMAKGLL